MGPMIPKEMKYNLHYGKVRRDILPSLLVKEKQKNVCFFYNILISYGEIQEKGSECFLDEKFNEK